MASGLVFAAVLVLVALGVAISLLSRGARPGLVMGLSGVLVGAGGVGVLARGDLGHFIGAGLVVAGVLTGFAAVANDAKGRNTRPDARHNAPSE